MFTSEQIQEYIEQFSAQQSDLLRKLEKETFQKAVFPQMISGNYQGRLLSMISKLKQPEQILEIGTFTGYATLCLAEGLAVGGTIHTIDKNDEHQAIQNKYFKVSGYGEQIKQYLGDAMEIVPRINKEFDLVFIDADKKNYPKYFDIIFPKMKKGGLILSDNVLWYGKVLNENEKDKETRAIQTYNEILKNHPSIEVIILPVRDGISMARVK